MAAPVRYRIIERNVQRLAAPGGPMGDMINDVTRTAMRIAKTSTAPVRSGKLRRGININYAKPNGYLQLQGVLYANARHALWVHEGTKGPIRSKSGKRMPVPRRGGGGRLFLSKVRGQRANPFLSRAISQALVQERRVRTIGANRI